MQSAAEVGVTVGITRSVVVAGEPLSPPPHPETSTDATRTAAKDAGTTRWRVRALLTRLLPISTTLRPPAHAAVDPLTIGQPLPRDRPTTRDPVAVEPLSHPAATLRHKVRVADAVRPGRLLRGREGGRSGLAPLPGPTVRPHPTPRGMRGAHRARRKPHPVGPGPSPPKSPIQPSTIGSHLNLEECIDDARASLDMMT